MNPIKEPQTKSKFLKVFNKIFCCNKHILISVVLFLLLGTGILGYQLLQRKQGQEVTAPIIKSPEKVSEPDKMLEDETANWQAYRNEEFGFEVKYPESLLASATGPNYVQQQLQKGEVISGTVQPSYDTIMFKAKAFQAEPRPQFEISIFYETEEPISVEGYDSSLYLRGPCDLRWLETRPETVRNITIGNVGFLEVKVTGQAYATTESPSYFSCYYFKNYNNNLIVLSTAPYDNQLDAESVDLLAQSVLKTLNLFETDSTANYVDVTIEKGVDIDFYPPTRKLIGVKDDGSKSVLLDDIDQALPVSRHGMEGGITKEQDNLSQDAFIYSFAQNAQRVYIGRFVDGTEIYDYIYEYDLISNKIQQIDIPANYIFSYNHVKAKSSDGEKVALYGSDGVGVFDLVMNLSIFSLRPEDVDDILLGSDTIVSPIENYPNALFKWESPTTLSYPIYQQTDGEFELKSIETVDF